MARLTMIDPLLRLYDLTSTYGVEFQDAMAKVTNEFKLDAMESDELKEQYDNQ